MVFKLFKFRRYNKKPQATESPENGIPASAMDELVLGCSSTTSGMIPQHSHSHAVNEIQQQTESATRSVDDPIKSSTAIEIPNIGQLENEFRVILISLTAGTNPSKSKSSTSSCSTSITDSAPSFEDCNFIKLNMEKKDDLHRIAERMKCVGHLEKCVEVYQSVRKTFLETTLRKLGIQKLSMNDIRSLEWEALEDKIRQWIQAAKIWVSVLFASENRLCKHVFGGLGNAEGYNNCFTETVKDPAFQLFESGKALSICTSDRSRHPEKLFRILDLHEMLLQLLDELDIIFRSKSLESVGIQATEMLSLLAKAAREILPQFENDMLHEQSHFQDHRGGIDALTKYVMRYVAQIVYYKAGLNKLIVSKPEYRSNCGDHMTIPEVKLAQLDGCTSTSTSSPLVVHLIWIIEILQFKLEAKSKRYKDPSLAQLFMMNNVHYIVEKSMFTNLGEMVGDDYLKMLIKNFQLIMNAYLGSTWERVLFCLRDEGLHVNRGLSFKVSKSALRERFKTLNATLEEVHQNQVKWVVTNQTIRNKLRHSISEKLIPAYSSFLERFMSHLNQDQQQKYIKYTVDDLRIAISSFAN